MCRDASSNPSRCAAARHARAARPSSTSPALAAAAARWRAVAALVHGACPTPDGEQAYVDDRARLARAPATRCRSSCATMRRATSSGCTRYFNVDATNRRARDRPHVVREARAAHAAQHRMQAPAADARVRDARLHRRRVPHALVQPCVAGGDRAPGRQAGRRAAQPRIACRRHQARHRRVLDHRQRVAGGAAAPALPARRSRASSGYRPARAREHARQSQQRFEVGGRHVHALRDLAHDGEQRVDLQRLARLDVLQHRRLECAELARDGIAVLGRLLDRAADRRADRLALPP